MGKIKDDGYGYGVVPPAPIPCGCHPYSHRLQAIGSRPMDFVFDVNTTTIKHAIQEDLALTLDNFNSTIGNLTTLVSKFTIVLGNFTIVLENFIVWVRNFINGYI
jgi:hypothetical protein